MFFVELRMISFEIMKFNEIKFLQEYPAVYAFSLYAVSFYSTKEIKDSFAARLIKFVKTIPAGIKFLVTVCFRNQWVESKQRII